MGTATSASFSEAPGSEREPSLCCCWNRSRCVIKSPCSSAAELVARAFAFGIDCFGFLFSRWWPQWRDSLIIVEPEIQFSCVLPPSDQHTLAIA
jgi:hypothetical protein